MRKIGQWLKLNIHLLQKGNNINALLIGCGNIGALYDLDNQSQVATHAKAFHLHKKISFSVADQNERAALRIAKRYNIPVVSLYNVVDFAAYDIISITSPTHTHEQYLHDAIRANVPVVICEKPISIDIQSLDRIVKTYRRGETKVLVNYIRRFQPIYAELKKKIKLILKTEKCTQIIIKYKRGILNNGSHAFDLLEYLFDQQVHFKKIVCSSKKFDSFKTDPTVSGSFLFSDDISVAFVGISGVTYPKFELDFYFENTSISIQDSGNIIKVKRNNKKLEVFNNAKNLLDRYMIPVIDEAVYLLEKKNKADNFIASVRMNKTIINTFCENI
jgi:predicted dehydrogenase